MSFEFLIDFRETKLHAKLSQILPIQPTSANLDIGDVQIVYKSAHAQEDDLSEEVADTRQPPPPQSFTLLFERKTTADLVASIKDHRYSEQKSRILSSSIAPHLCTYIIEGHTMGSTHTIPGGISAAVFESALIHTMYRDKIHVITTSSVDGTASYLHSVLLKCMANPQYFTQQYDACDSPYVATLKHKLRKIENIDKQTCYIMQLSQIPGISYKIAKEIAEVYPTMHSLTSGLHACVTEKEKVTLLTKIKMIAEKKAKTIVEYFS